MRYKRWILLLGKIVIVSFCAVIGFNLLVDPYDIYPVPKVSGITSNKNTATHFSRHIKPFKLTSIKPQALAFGTSRTEIGIDPGHPGWRLPEEKVYNFGLNSAGIAEINYWFDKYAAQGELKKVVVGLDLFSFNAYLSGNNSGKLKAGLKSRTDIVVETLISLPGVKNSLRTLRKQDPYRHPELLPNGQIVWHCFDYRVSRSGHRTLFLESEKKFLNNNLKPLPDRRFSFEKPSEQINTFEQFRALLKSARKYGVELILYISPCHARMLEVYYRAGLWDSFERWKRTLVEVVEEEASQNGSPPYMLWDFTGYSSITTEPVPRLGDTVTRMGFYWEASHYTKRTGDLILSKILSPNWGGKVEEAFGRVINRQNIDSHLKRMREARLKYVAAHAEDVVDVDKMIAAFEANN